MSARRSRSLVAALVLASALGAQVSDRIHPYLADRIARARPGDKLEVYFVMAERLEHDHWFPRVDRLAIGPRRALVTAELQAHAARTQAKLMAELRRREAQGQVDRLVSNWLGNFVHCRATPRAIRDVAGLTDVEEVRYNAAWSVGLVVDESWREAGVSRAMPTTRGANGSAPANGVVHTKADQVWALGFTGTGVVVMNADSGINIDHGDLADRLWTNPGEVPANGIDDDQNGYVDDVHGWNFFDDNPVIDDGGAHGTNTAGTLVGDGLCSGTITGQAPGARVMTAALGPPTPQTGPFTPAGEVAQWDAIQYAIQMGAHVQTSSYSYKNGFVPPPNYKMHREVGDNSLAAGLIRTNSTGNNGTLAGSSTDLNRIPFNVSTPGNLPPPYLDPHQTLVGGKGGVIGVGAHDMGNGQLLGYSPLGPCAWHVDDVLAVNPSYPHAFWTASHNDYPWLGGTSLGLIKPDLTGPTNTTTTTGGGASCALSLQSGTSNATPRVAGCLVLWKGANMSLGPEDMAMIAHQTARPSGTVNGKEDSWGAGRVDALAGLYLALCTHRVNGEPAWAVDHQAGTTATWEVDTVPDAPLTIIALGGSRLSFPGLIGIGAPIGVAYSGPAGASGEMSFQAMVPAILAGFSIFSQCFTDDTAGATRKLLSSNVIETRFVP